MTGDEFTRAAERTFALLVVWALASTATANAYVYGVGFAYFAWLGRLLVVSGIVILVLHREEIRERLEESWASWQQAGEPVDPDDVIDDVLEDSDGST